MTEFKIVGSASGSSTLRMICSGVAPIDCAASTKPVGTSSSALSIRRATNGIAPIVSGTMAAVVPIKVPTISLVTGMMATINTKKGTERPMLTTAPSARFSGRFSSKPSFLVVWRITPSGIPSAKPTAPAIATIYSVCHVAVNSRSLLSANHCAIVLKDITQHLYFYVVFAQITNRGFIIVGITKNFSDHHAKLHAAGVIQI
ncbi:Uncharacterised protein [Vibrio cholerae]|nr:Uncharacterised protein [Vibrio cholerae]